MARADPEAPLPRLHPTAPVLNDIESAPATRSGTPLGTPGTPVSKEKSGITGREKADRRAGKKGGGLTAGDECEFKSSLLCPAYDREWFWGGVCFSRGMERA